MLSAHVGTVVGFYLTAALPALLTAAMLFLTPMSFLVSTTRNARTLTDALALALGLIVCPLLVYAGIGLDLMWTGIIAGTAAYGVHRLRGGLAMSGFEGLWGYFVLMLVGFLPCDVWRMLGVAVARGLDEESEMLIWVRAVATAVLAGVIAKIVFFPPGSLAGVPLSVRLAAIGCGLCGVLAGAAVGVRRRRHRRGGADRGRLSAGALK